MADKPNPNRRPRPATVTKGAPTVAQPTAASAWKKKTLEGTLLVVPSGHQCLVRAPGMEAFIRQGFIPNSLMPIVTEAMKKGKPPSDMELNMEDPEVLGQLMDVFDDVLCYCMIQPSVLPPPVIDTPQGQIVAPIEERNPEQLYSDEVDFQDKVFIFQWAVGGTADLEKFRQQLG